LILDALSAAGLALQAGDVVVLAQKIVSKAEGRLIELRNRTHRPEASRSPPIGQGSARRSADPGRIG
jgi:F420-0:gamma-glutamyl ligase